jgi:hypothetical protein
MGSSTNHRLDSIGKLTGARNKKELIKLPDKNETALQNGDILANTQTEEKLIVLGYNDEADTIKYYSNYEGSTGHHSTEFIPSCFDMVFRITNGESKTIQIEKKQS